MEEDVYDLCIIGAGLIGSAAARHASQWGRICLVGPEEPEVRNINDERDIFGGHYDEGRITRCTDPDPVWALLAQKSVPRYRKLEDDTGISFYEEIGCLLTGEENGEYLQNIDKTVKSNKLNVTYLTNNSLKEKFPFLNISSLDAGIFEFKNAGYISARNLVRAQIMQAVSYGCKFIPEVANNVWRIVKNGEYFMHVTTEKKKDILSRTILLATGAFTGFRNLLHNSIQLDVELFPTTVSMVEISESDFNKIRKIPSVIYRGSGATDWIKTLPRDTNGNFTFYMLPPIKYPDGKYYIKLGHSHPTNRSSFTTSKEVKDWYCGGSVDKSLVDRTAELITNVVKGIKMISHKGDWCVITETPTGRPYIDKVHSQLGVAVGGNGYAAKSSDEIGRIAAAMMMRNVWDSSIPKDLFSVKFKNARSKY